MGIYAKVVEDKIKGIKESYNILQMYDNYTYHIQMYMLPKKIQQQIDLVQDYEVVDKIINSNKVIIFESGVTPNVNIKNLVIHSVVPGGNLLSTATTFDLGIDELGSDLINKLAVVSKVLGYENHIIHPYYLEIWFTGYENVTSKSYNKFGYSKGIPQTNIGGKHFRYQCVITKCKTTQQSDKMSYDFKLSWMPNRASLKDYSLIFDMGQITCNAGSTYKSFLDELKIRLNLVFKDRLSNAYQSIYGNDDMWDIEVIDNNNQCINKTFKESITIKLDSDKLLNNLILETWQMVSGVDKHSVFVYPKMIFEKEENSMSYFKVKLFVCFYVCPGLDKLQENVAEDGSYFLKSIENQMEYLNDLLPTEKSEIKKYNIHSFGKNTNVLNYKEDEDYLWYLNIGVGDKNSLDTSSLLTNYIEYHKDELTTYQQTTEKFNNGIHNIDDIYESLTYKQKELYLDILNIGIVKESPTPTVIENNTNVDEEKSQDVTSNELQKLQLKAKLGYNSLFEVSNRKSLDIDIIGDPYWLGISDEYFLSHLKDNLTNFVIPHIILSTKSFQRLDSNYDYKVNENKCFNTPFRILQVTSTFSGGKFTQKLNGVIAIPFIQSTKDVIFESVRIKEKRAETNVPKEG